MIYLISDLGPAVPDLTYLGIAAIAFGLAIIAGATLVFMKG